MSPEFRDHLLDLLAPLGPVTARRMFGGGGLFLDGAMFALVVDDVLYFKTDDANRPAFEAAGAGPFTYERAGKSVALGYFEAPEDLMEDAEEMARWARDAWAAARRAAARSRRTETAKSGAGKAGKRKKQT